MVYGAVVIDGSLAMYILICYSYLRQQQLRMNTVKARIILHTALRSPNLLPVKSSRQSTGVQQDMDDGCDREFYS